MTVFWHIGSDQLVNLEALTDATDSSPVNDATVTAQLYDSEGEKEGSVFTLSHVTSSDGDYQGVLQNTLTATLVDGQSYFLLATAVGSAFTNIFREDGTAKTALG